MRLALDRAPWRVRGYLGDEWRHHRVWGPLREPDAWLPARVPGSVVDDLWRANVVPDPYVGLNTRAIEWVSDRHWAYRHEFRLESPPDGRQAFLCLDGVDHSAIVYLDGRELGRVDGMFVRTRFDVTGQLRTSPDHVLVIVVEPSPVSEPQVGHTSKVRAHKSRMTYGWDFCPRLVHQGIWQSVYVEVTGPARITDITVTADQVIVGASGNDLVELALMDADDVVVARGDRVLTVQEPQLWWPNGSGTPYRYRLTATAYSDGEVSDRLEVAVGFRTLRFFRAEGAPDDAKPYGIEVNGLRIFVKGWNWVPLDLSYGVPRPDRLAHLLDLAVDAGVNLLRVWGGGLIESEDFYAACDQRGLLVWQEFSQSSSGISSTPAGDEEFVAMMRAQAEQVVPRRRHHPSLAIWGGGNELQAGEGAPLTEARVLSALEDVVRRLDPTRLWLPTSPSGPAFLNRLDLIQQAPQDQHDVHGPWEHQGLNHHYALYDEGTAQLLSEFGVEAMTMPRSLAAVVPEPERRLPTRGRPVWDHLGRWWNNESLVQASFGNRIEDVGTLGLASQFLQRDGLGYAVAANRRRWPHCVGDTPVAVQRAVPERVVHRGHHPRRRSQTCLLRRRRRLPPVLVGAVCTRQTWSGHSEVRLPLWLLSDDPIPTATITTRLVGLSGEELRTFTVEDVTTTAGRAQVFGELRAPTPAGTFFVDMRLIAGEVRAERRYVLTGADDLSEILDGRAELDVRLSGDQLIVRHVAGPAAPFVRVRDGRPLQGDSAGWLRVSDSGFVLLPGEERVLDLRWEGVGGDRVVVVDGLGLRPTERLIRC